MLEPNGDIVSWTRTVPEAGNRWRGLAGGARVVSFPLWLYCDDVSGNQSKKWNEHHSFLFSAAGLPRSLSQQESNVHFLCTSNLAPPLEMLDKIVTQFEYVMQSLSIGPSCILMSCNPVGKCGLLGSGHGIVSPRTVCLSFHLLLPSLVTTLCKVNLPAILVKVASIFAGCVR